MGSRSCITPYIYDSASVLCVYVDRNRVRASHLCFVCRVVFACFLRHAIHAISSLTINMHASALCLPELKIRTCVSLFCSCVLLFVCVRKTLAHITWTKSRRYQNAYVRAQSVDAMLEASVQRTLRRGWRRLRNNMKLLQSRTWRRQQALSRIPAVC